MTTETATDTDTVTVCELAPATLYAMIDQVLHGVARDDSRPVLTGVHIKIENGTLTLASADGFQLWVLSTPCAGAAAAAIITADTLKATLPALKAAIKAAGKYDANRTTVTLTIGEHCAIDTGIARIALLKIAGTYPNYGALIPALDSYATDAGCHIAINGTYLAKIAAAAGKYGDSGILRMRTTTPSSPMRCDWKSDKWSATAVVMPMFVSWDVPAPEPAPEPAPRRARASVCESCTDSARKNDGASADIAESACIGFGADMSDHYCEREDGTDCACTGH